MDSDETNDFPIYLTEIKLFEKELFSCILDGEINEELIFFVSDYENKLRSKGEFDSFLRLFLEISNNVKHFEKFYDIVSTILKPIKDRLKKIYSNKQIFNIFESNKIILLYLFDNNIISPDQSFVDYYKKDRIKRDFYIPFFYPEFKPFLDEKMQNELEKKYPDLKPENCEIFKSKIIKGQNDNNIAELIRKESIDQIDEYFTLSNISVNSDIRPSIYETNLFLIGKSVSIIEYAVFFGSYDTFIYLLNKKADLYDELWFATFHNYNPEFIHKFEEKKLEPNKKLINEYITEIIKCHDRNTLIYFIENFDVPDISKLDSFIIIESIKYQSYDCFPKDFKFEDEYLYYLCICNLDTFVNVFINSNYQKFDVNKLVIKKFNF